MEEANRLKLSTKHSTAVVAVKQKRVMDNSDTYFGGRIHRLADGLGGVSLDRSTIVSILPRPGFVFLFSPP